MSAIDSGMFRLEAKHPARDLWEPLPILGAVPCVITDGDLLRDKPAVQLR
jgi:hypothetical protein